MRLRNTFLMLPNVKTCSVNKNSKQEISKPGDVGFFPKKNREVLSKAGRSQDFVKGMDIYDTMLCSVNCL